MNPEQFLQSARCIIQTSEVKAQIQERRSLTPNSIQSEAFFYIELFIFFLLTVITLLTVVRRLWGIGDGMELQLRTLYSLPFVMMTSIAWMWTDSRNKHKVTLTQFWGSAVSNIMMIFNCLALITVAGQDYLLFCVTLSMLQGGSLILVMIIKLKGQTQKWNDCYLSGLVIYESFLLTAVLATIFTCFTCLFLRGHFDPQFLAIFQFSLILTFWFIFGIMIRILGLFRIATMERFSTHRTLRINTLIYFLFANVPALCLSTPQGMIILLPALAYLLQALHFAINFSPQIINYSFFVYGQSYHIFSNIAFWDFGLFQFKCTAFYSENKKHLKNYDSYRLDQCPLCCTNQSDMVQINCKHISLCHQCFWKNRKKGMTKCIICGEKVTSVAQLDVQNDWGKQKAYEKGGFRFTGILAHQYIVKYNWRNI